MSTMKEKRKRKRKSMQKEEKQEWRSNKNGEEAKKMN
jgi:hypothetical protein